MTIRKHCLRCTDQVPIQEPQSEYQAFQAGVHLVYQRLIRPLFLLFHRLPLLDLCNPLQVSLRFHHRSWAMGSL